ncbi:MAG: methyl-accepting chemotaxis protein, partial [Cyclobacteriaceae bacterium]|nr:methyl-accepting chemotaxis protein [Cyclobacteriaceae bacterium]
KDGSKFWGNLSLTRVEVRGELQYTAFIKDITEERAVKLQAESVKIAVDTGSVSAEFDLDGTIISANSNFISIVGHKKESDLVGQHHRVICEKSYVDSQEYAKFWKDLANGDIQSGEYKLIDKGGSDVWVQSAYVPVRNEEGDVYKVIKIATDVTDVKVPILQVKDIISNVAQGDLTQKFDEAASGYVKEMGDALNVALDNLNALLNNIQENSNLLGASSEQMLTKSDQMQGTTQEVASAIGEMAEGTQQQAEQIDQASQLLEGVRNASLEVTDKSQDINKAAEASQGSVGVGLETVKKVVDSMTEIQESAQTTSDSINVLTERSEEIARTLNVITDIAAQTNLLALNAAIEAARAGDAGRGFAVVAEEIRKLAEDSRKSAGNIEKVISAVGKDVASAGKAISTMDSSVKIGNDASGDAEKVFNEISVTTEQTLRLSVEVLASAEVQKQNIDDTVKNIEQIVVVSEETASGTEEIATSSKDLSNGMDEFNSTSKGLAEIATQIQDGVSKFTLRQ